MKPYTPPPRPKGSPPKTVDVPKPGPMWSVPTKALTGKNAAHHQRRHKLTLVTTGLMPSSRRAAHPALRQAEGELASPEIRPPQLARVGRHDCTQ